MHILFTRPLEDCHEMILKFQTLGHNISHLPLISIEGLKYRSLNYSDFKGIIFTSSNAIKFLDIKNIDKNIICFCVGSATEKKARSSGFQNVFAADGNVDNLKELILLNFNHLEGKLLYVSGEIVSSNLDGQLHSDGYNIDSNYYMESLNRVISQYRQLLLCTNTTPFIVGETTGADFGSDKGWEARNIELRTLNRDSDVFTKCIYSSDLPFEYMSAVSIQLIP